MLRGPIGLSRATRRRLVSPWTKQRTRVLRRRWAQGARVREIAAELGHGITYNAVIGKIHRLGIADRPTPLERRRRGRDGRPMMHDRRLPGLRTPCILSDQ